MNLRHVSDAGHARRLWLREGLACVYISDSTLDEPQPGIRRAVLVVHGTERDGHRYWRALDRAARLAGRGIRNQTLLAAPQFYTRREARARGLGASTLAWAPQAWKQGDASRHGTGISAFSVLDAMVRRLACRERFPDLERLVIVGHSAGAQFVQRHAAASSVPALTRELGIALRHIVVGPSSYLYLDAARRGHGPDGAYGQPSGQALLHCPDYDHYKYGLQRPNAYVSRIDPDELRRSYAGKEVVYLVGEHDNDPNDPHLDRSAAAMLQGSDRRDRCLAYRDYLAYLYGSLPASHVFEIVPRLGHEGARILRSPIGLRWLFDME
ncbi:hypothetical protein [Bordetella genomosp. 4]|uniref:Alpha/beta hydrolase n=1 Tax=Bordetella genomosp. 4 TaxID=463044 RepID=A0A261U3F3_9BORD|nr:hypothetical protein [Bordetella genomosp. 4]OZI56494.1 hypothetical protein CAL20_13785 [Bordetella genomosp. 4]